MNRYFGSLALLIGSVFSSLPSTATTVPPRIPTFEEEVCSANYVFIGKAESLRIIPAPEGFNCTSRKLDPSVSVCSATAIALDMRIERVLAPRIWAHPETVVLLLPAGYSIHGTRATYEGQRHIFKTGLKDGASDNFHVPASWGFSFPLDLEERVEHAITTCGPRQ